MQSPRSLVAWHISNLTLLRETLTFKENMSNTCAVMTEQIGEKQQVNMATTRIYTFTAWKIWFRNYYVAHAFVVCNDC